MADWSELPKELLHLISKHLESPLYLLRFRSVCSSWRSSSFPLPITLSNHPISHTFSLSTRTLFLITPPNDHSLPWLIKIAHQPRSTTRLYDPLSGFLLKRHRFLLDLYHLPVLHLAHEFSLADTCPNSLYMEKVVLSCLTPQNDRFVLLTIHISGKLALFKCGDSDWTIIPDMPTPYDDVCVFERGLYAVDNTGRTVKVGLDSGLDLVAEPVFGGDKKYLVESEGELLLVDKYLSSNYFCSSGLFFEEYDEEDDGELCEFGWERTVRFGLFRLDQEGKRWVELKSLGERVLFLGDDCAFSASARDLRVARGNCVLFRDDAFGVDGVGSGIGVFCCDDGRISPLSDCPGYSQLFWPPPDWVGLH
ncbi:F-box protein SKIP23-like [Abrus precatorius]|uniref:F-box protein SKIP23-like n=1 Tax=Abrus precatorius TaxID=3816 RepID=A0A8B8KE45_ABRPR|nr:F-box protein SKIP23-like [Abrus precatorius]XP_027342022.1 F-box protein SKIP23-like [Abrus precatorius]